MSIKGKEDRQKPPSSLGLIRLWLERRTADSTHFETPLRVVFLTFLALAISILTLQNVFSEYRNLNETQDALVQTTESLLMQQRTLASQALDQALRFVRTNSDLKNAVLNEDNEDVTRVVRQVFAQKGVGLNISELTIFSADRTPIFTTNSRDRRDAKSNVEQSGTRFDTALITRKLEVDTDAQIVSSVLRPWISKGQHVGYLKLSLNIERSLALASSAVDAQILKVFEPHPDNSGTEPDVRYEVVGSAPQPELRLADLGSAVRMPGGLRQFLIQDGKVLLVRNLPIRVLSDTGQARLTLVKDISSSVWSFANRTLVSLFAGLALVLLSWAVIHRLLTRLQNSVEATRARLEAEVLENTQKLERSALQLLDAQRIAKLGSWETDLDTGKVEGSEEFHRIMNVPVGLTAQAMQEKIISRIPVHDAERALSGIKRAIANCGEFEFENTMVLDDGSLRYLEARGYAVAGPDGNASRVTGIIHDITERHKAERQNQLLANILESSLNEIYILDAKTLRIEHANACALENLGYDLQDLKISSHLAHQSGGRGSRTASASFGLGGGRGRQPAGGEPPQAPQRQRIPGGAQDPIASRSRKKAVRCHCK